MLSERDRRFMEYWSENRLKEKKTMRQFLFGLPIGLLFAAPIILSFTSGWHLEATAWARGHVVENIPGTLIIATLGILIFVAIFSKRFRWEMNEQAYRELEAKIKREAMQPGEKNGEITAETPH